MQTIQEVLLALDDIIKDCIERKSPLGVFAFVYRRVTAEVKAGIEKGDFADNTRMECLDVVFAKRYIDAYWKYRNGQPVTSSWAAAFRAEPRQLAILQHLLLGMNAHIHLDLGVAAAQVAPGEGIQTLQSDFEQINVLLLELVDEIQSRLASVSKGIMFLDWMGRNRDEWLAGLGIRVGRNFAWKQAQRLARLEGDKQEKAIQQLDKHVVHWSNLIANPTPTWIWFFWRILYWLEERDVDKVLA
ncbi:MAG: DUF5995 family protein, partial [Bacteroidota bacterium]